TSPGSQPTAPTRPAKTSNNKATAPNDSQKPRPRGANGSTSSTSPNASRKGCHGLASRALSRYQPPTTTLISARCVGTVNPASSAYDRQHAITTKNTVLLPRCSVTIPAGNPSRNLRLNRPAASATNPRCSPEIATR